MEGKMKNFMKLFVAGGIASIAMTACSIVDEYDQDLVDRYEQAIQDEKDSLARAEQDRKDSIAQEEQDRKDAELKAKMLQEKREKLKDQRSREIRERLDPQPEGVPGIQPSPAGKGPLLRAGQADLLDAGDQAVHQAAFLGAVYHHFFAQPHLYGGGKDADIIILGRFSDAESALKARYELICWLQSEAFGTFEMPKTDEGGDA